MSEQAAILKTLGIETWTKRSSTLSYWVVTESLVPSILLDQMLKYLNWPARDVKVLTPEALMKMPTQQFPAVLLSFGRSVSESVQKNLDKGTRFVETWGVNELLSQPKLKQKVLYDLRCLVV